MTVTASTIRLPLLAKVTLHVRGLCAALDGWYQAHADDTVDGALAREFQVWLAVGGPVDHLLDVLQEHDALP